MELKKLNSKIQLANRDRSNIKALQEAIEAESLLPVVENLQDQDDKFRSVHELEAAINELKWKLQDMHSLAVCLPIARKIKELKNLVDLNVSFGAGSKVDVEAESRSLTGNETLPVSNCATDELSNACDDPEERFMKLEDMMIEQRNMMVQLSDRVGQLSDRVGVLEKKN